MQFTDGIVDECPIHVHRNNNEEEKSSDLIKDDKQNENIANENGGHGSEGKGNIKFDMIKFFYLYPKLKTFSILNL